MIDLHLHSTFSDGDLTPEALVDRAADAGVNAIALTDHDTVDGIPRFLRHGRDRLRELVPGVEISVDCPRGTLHMLGYFIDHTDTMLNKILQRIRNGRSDRNKQILRKINELGMPLPWSEVQSFAGEDVVGRPHFAQAMLARGYIKNVKAAFDVYLAKGKPAYADRLRLPSADSIRAIRAGGGVPVLAHPFTLDLSESELSDFVATLANEGLQGIEAYYPEHSKTRTQQYLALAKRFDLAVTGGTDYHGTMTPKIRIGTGFGRLSVPDELLDRLRARAQ